jgi:hypothetical protein
MLIPVLLDRTTKPPMGTPLRSDGHWSVRRFGFVLPLNEHAGKNVFETKSGMANTNTPTDVKWTGGEILNTSATSNGILEFTGKQLLDLYGDFTLIFCGSPEYGGGSVGHLGGQIINSNPQYQQFLISSNSSNTLGYYAGSIAFSGYAYSLDSISVPNVVDGLKHTYVFTRLGATWNVYVDGKHLWEESKTATSYLHPTQSFSINGLKYFESSRSIGKQYYWMGWNRYLTPLEIFSISVNPWQIYEPETVWINVGSASALFEGAFSSSFSISPSLSGKLGVGGGLASTAGSATYANAGKEGKQGPLTTTLAALVQALAGKEGKQGPISINTAALIQALTGGAGNKGTLASQTIVNPALSGNAGNKGTLAATISLSALFSQAALFEGTVSAAMAAIAPSFAGNSGNLGTLLTTISAASAIAAITGNAGYLQSVLTDLALQEIGQIGSTGTAALTISTGTDMNGKLGVSAEIAATLADLGAYLVEIIVGDKIHRIVIATTTGQAVILTATGTITFN